jgi:large subunit ribosomal protein L13|tara:strand:+ start:113 stop:568 length:456 start_codon:yes stop_codon:yes gene_type:complete
VDTLSYKTISENAATVNKEWLLVDAEGQTLGRLASTIARLVRGKHKTGFTPHVDCGDNVVVINAEKVTLTGNKSTEKRYIRYTGYPGGQRILSADQLLAKHPTALVEKAVKGMLPKNKLGNAIFKNLYVYAGTEHNQEAQKPKAININEIK